MGSFLWVSAPVQDISDVVSLISFKIWYLWRIEIRVECHCDDLLWDCSFVKVPGIRVLCACDVCQALDLFLA